jgi:uncharacterized membrane protein YgdD (TMEM256/DUF423 family)
MNKSLLLSGLILGVTAIILGAFGAHALKTLLSYEQLQTFETGVKYQMYHALFILIVANSNHLTEKVKLNVVKLAVLGVLLFSGSIYLLATQTISGINFKPIGFLTPIGGLFLIASWAWFGIKIIKNKS